MNRGMIRVVSAARRVGSTVGGFFVKSYFVLFQSGPCFVCIPFVMYWS